MKPLKKVEHSIVEITSLKRNFVFWGFILTLFLGTLLSWIQFGTILSQPNNQFVSNTPSANLAYFTTAWHILNDSSWVNYAGMNYPFNEHIGYAYNQPLISELARSWHQNVSNLSNVTAALINLSQIFYIVLGAGALFLILSKLHLPAWYAIPGALAISFLSPQTSAFPLHSEWAHTFFIPMLLYWLCRYEERSSRRYQSLHVAVLITAAAMIQPGYYGVSALFLTCFTGFQLLRKPSKSNISRRLSHWAVMTLIPLVILNIWIHWENAAADRPTAATTHQILFVNWKNLLLPSFDTNSTNLPVRTGILALIYLVVLSSSGFKMFGKSWSSAAYHRVHYQYLRGLLLAGTTLLIPALGFNGAELGISFLRIKDAAPFTWFFYYITNVLALYGAWNWAKRFDGFGVKKVLPKFKMAILALPLLIVSTEAAYTSAKMPSASLSPNLLKKEVALSTGMNWLNTVDFKPFQAILPLPYYHSGSNFFELAVDTQFLYTSSATALHTGLPNMGVFLKQTPLHETLLSLQLLLTPCELPSILSNLPDNRPIAVFVDYSKWTQVKNQYPHLTLNTTELYQDAQIMVLRLEIETIRNNIKKELQLIQTAINETPTLPNLSWKSTQLNPFFYYNSFDTTALPGASFQGKGALCKLNCDTTLLWRGIAPPGDYTLNFWMKLDKAGGHDQSLHLVESGAPGHHTTTQTYTLKQQLQSIVKGWGCFEIHFTLKNNTKTTIFLQNKDACKPFFLDELLLRPTSLNLLRKEQGWVIQNNYWHREKP